MKNHRSTSLKAGRESLPLAGRGSPGGEGEETGVSRPHPLSCVPRGYCTEGLKGVLDARVGQCEWRLKDKILLWQKSQHGIKPFKRGGGNAFKLALEIIENWTIFPWNASLRRNSLWMRRKLNNFSLNSSRGISLWIHRKFNNIFSLSIA